MPFESDFDDELAPDEPTGPSGDPFDDFLNGIQGTPSTFDPSMIIKIVSTAGGSVDVPVDPAHTTADGQPGYTIDEVLVIANFAVSPNTQYWVNNAQVERSFVVAPGAVITAVGMVKGGTR